MLFYSPQGSTFVGMGSGAPEMPELLTAWDIAGTQPQGDIYSGNMFSRLGVGRRANNSAPLKIYCSDHTLKKEAKAKLKGP
jgi:hypothetical protein